MLVVCLQRVLCWGPFEYSALLVNEENGEVTCCGRLVFPLQTNEFKRTGVAHCLVDLRAIVRPVSVSTAARSSASCRTRVEES